MLLLRLLSELERQEVDSGLTFSVIVADNDADRSAFPVVSDFASRSRLSFTYCHEPRRNIALARNCALRHARGDYVAWIDDDEVPERYWLRNLVAAAKAYDCAGVIGPVRPYFDATPPRWLIEGRFCERPEYAGGTVMHWSRSFAGNSLIRLDLLRAANAEFAERFGLGGEDVEFFRRMNALGLRFVWCNDAVILEIVPPNRWSRTYRIRRALSLGRATLELGGSLALVKSFVAVPVYLSILPLTLLFGQHVFMKFAIKLSSHVGRLLAWLGYQTVAERPQ